MALISNEAKRMAAQYAVNTKFQLGLAFELIRNDIVKSPELSQLVDSERSLIDDVSMLPEHDEGVFSLSMNANAKIIEDLRKNPEFKDRQMDIPGIEHNM